MNGDAHPAWWNLAPDDLLARLNTSRQGLSAAEAAARLRRHGPNTVDGETQDSAPRILLRQFESPLVLILVFAAVVSLVLRDWVDASLILAIVVCSSLLGFAQEFGASNAVAALRRRLALMVQAWRGGSLQAVPASTIVPGDVIALAAGDLVPADGLVLEAKDFLVTEASLTGESFPVEKQPGVLPPETPLSGRSNCVFLGTSVRSGTATVLIVGTGRATAFGAVAARLKARAPETDFARGVRHFGYLLLRVMIAMVLFVLTVNLLFERPLIESLLFAVALAVGLSPELLPAIVTVTLSAGARAMARRGVIVRRLEAIENLGSIDILCTDKTGTLTEGTMTLSAAVDADGSESARVRHLAYVNAALESGIANPLDAALVAAAGREGWSAQGWRKVDEIPYDFLRRRLTIVAARADDPHRCRIVTKGAFENVLAVCSTLERGGTEAPLGPEERSRLEDYYRRKGAEGFRVLALATKDAAPRQHYGHEDERELCFVGFLVFFDPPKAQAPVMIRDLAALGIRLKVISGDNRHVTAHVARVVGLDPQAMLTGEEIAALKDEALWHRAERTDLFVEVDPQQKERIVRALQRTGHAVGYLGAGISGAPALHAADIGISVDQAVDVARESADVILLQHDLDVLRTGVEDGRRTFANTLKYISITTSANFGNMVSMALATLFLPFLPLAAKQILLNNFLSDLPSMAISTDNVDAYSIARPQRWQAHDIRSFMLVFGLLSTVFDLLTFLVLLQVFRADEATFQTAWFVVSLMTELAVVLVLRSTAPAWRSAPSHMLLWITVAVGAVALILPYAAAVAVPFGFLPLSAPLLGAMMLIIVSYVAATEAAKTWFYRGRAAVARP